jgi:aspartyl protease/PDZ domain-containing protein
MNPRSFHRVALGAAVLAACATAASRPGPAGRATTSIGPDAAPLLDAWAEAIGGRARLARTTLVHERGRAELGGLAGSFQRWSTSRGQRREEIALGDALRTAQVFDGARGWLSDRNRQVRDLDGPEIEEQQAQVYLAAWAALLPGRRAGSVVRGAAGELVVAPAGGRPLTVTFDPATHLPRTIARRDAEKTRTLELSDWREVAGIRFPFTFRDGAGDPRDTLVVHLEAVELDGRAPAETTFARPPDGPRDWRLAAGGDHASFPIELAGGLVLAKVGVNGSAPLDFIVDTGAEVSVINASRVAQLGLTPVGKLAGGAGGGDVPVSYLMGVSFSLPGVTLADQIVTAIPLDALEPLFGRRIDGVLGYDFLSRFVVELDYLGRTITVRDPARFRYRGKGTAVPITLEGSIPNVRATVAQAGRPPLPARFVIDTGCTCEVSFNSPFTAANRLLEAVPKVIHPPAGMARGAGGELREVYGRIEALILASAVVKRPVAQFSQDTAGAMADPESAGLLGGKLWRRFLVTFDYQHKTMWLEPNARFAADDEAIGTGVGWATSGDRLQEITVMAVMDGSPGAEAGVRAGDRLVSLDGTPAAKLTLDQVDRQLRGEWGAPPALRPHILILRRDGVEVKVTLTPRSLF